MTRVFIYGSCVTRDAEPWFKDFGLEMVGYVARQSLASAFRTADASEFDFSKLASSFQRRMYQGDVVGNLRFEIDRASPDVVIWDLCDERLGVKLVPSGGAITQSMNHVEEGAHSGPLGRTLEFGQDEHFDLWKRGLAEFLRSLGRFGLEKRLYLNATPWAVDDEFRDDHSGQRAIASKFNDISKRYIEQALTEGVSVVRMDNDNAISRTVGHKWGPAPFHYTDETYIRMVQGISDAIHKECGSA